MRPIDADLVDAQQPPGARPDGRLSTEPLLWNKVRKGLSAGQVQSVNVAPHL